MERSNSVLRQAKQKRITEISKIKENKVCADCNKS